MSCHYATAPHASADATPQLLLLIAGALLVGDIVNGETRTVERANKMVGRGYSAIYFYNSTRQYQMAAGIMRTAGTLFDVDVPLPETAW